MKNYAPPTDDQGWLEIINRLRAFAEDQISIYSWFRGENALPQGYTADDFTQEAILRHCENPSKYDPGRGEFLAFLKYYILKRLVYNLSMLTENALTTDIYRMFSEEEEEDTVSYEDYLPTAILDIDGQIDHDKYLNLIIEKIDGETLLETIFEAIFINNLKRREICKQYHMTEQDYDNAVRRLNTIIKTVKLLIR